MPTYFEVFILIVYFDNNDDIDNVIDHNVDDFDNFDNVNDVEEIDDQKIFH